MQLYKDGHVLTTNLASLIPLVPVPIHYRCVAWIVWPLRSRLCLKIRNDEEGVNVNGELGMEEL